MSIPFASWDLPISTGKLPLLTPSFPVPVNVPRFFSDGSNGKMSLVDATLPEPDMLGLFGDDTRVFMCEDDDATEPEGSGGRVEGLIELMRERRVGACKARRSWGSSSSPSESKICGMLDRIVLC